MCLFRASAASSDNCPIGKIGSLIMAYVKELSMIEYTFFSNILVYNIPVRASVGPTGHYKTSPKNN